MSTPLVEQSPVSFSGAVHEDADVHASSDEYAARFGDSIGQWMLSIQERTVVKMLDSECVSILDVGGGHGQIAIPLSQAERSVTVLGSSPVCAQRLHDYIESGSISFKSGNLLQLPFEAQSFNLTVSFRLMSHCSAWPTLVAELCRVSSHAVIIDYPIWLSFNILSPLLFRVKKWIEGNTRTFRVFTNREVIREFKKHGFRLERVERQFFFPMAVHRAFKAVPVSCRLCELARTVGLTRLFGSPVIAKFVRE
jgi:ubiquinone/menaquinone biosynthesis C-methylase UbiE